MKTPTNFFVLVMYCGIDTKGTSFLRSNELLIRCTDKFKSPDAEYRFDRKDPKGLAATSQRDFRILGKTAMTRFFIQLLTKSKFQIFMTSYLLMSSYN